MKIAVVGWGSLVWDSRCLCIEPKWRTDGPMLPVEFVRVSKGNRLTLVLDPEARPQPVLWTVSKLKDIEEAKEDLRTRERTTMDNIGFWTKDAASPGKTALVVGEWCRSKKLGGAVWTALGPRDAEGKERVLSEDEAVQFLKRHAFSGNAVDYIRKAPPQIDTEYRRRFTREMDWKNVQTAGRSEPTKN